VVAHTQPHRGVLGWKRPRGGDGPGTAEERTA
jgi:hypothetical protein